MWCSSGPVARPGLCSECKAMSAAASCRLLPVAPEAAASAGIGSVDADAPPGAVSISFVETSCVELPCAENSSSDTVPKRPAIVSCASNERLQPTTMIIEHKHERPSFVSERYHISSVKLESLSQMYVMSQVQRAPNNFPELRK